MAFPAAEKSLRGFKHVSVTQLKSHSVNYLSSILVSQPLMKTKEYSRKKFGTKHVMLSHRNSRGLGEPKTR